MANVSDKMHHFVGFQRRRLIPAPLPDTSSLGKKAGAAGQWVDLPPLSGVLKEPFEIKVYEIDDVERLQRRRQEETAEVSKRSWRHLWRNFILYSFGRYNAWFKQR